MRRLLVFAIAVSACRGAEVSVVADELLVPESVDCADAFIGFSTQCLVPLENRSRRPVTVALSASGPFELETNEVVLQAGDQRDVRVLFRPQVEGEVTAQLEVGTPARTVSLRGVGRRPLECPSMSDCVARVFDASTGSCVERPASDGTSCGSLSQCVVNGRCVAGECVGEARSCDDRNACTTDACDAMTGCTHEAVVCAAPANPCLTAVCNAVTGCGTEPVVDGTSCGENDCENAHVCVAGSCVVRPSPMGSTCAPATACQAAGRCSSTGQCERAAPGAPQELWRFTAPAGQWLQTVQASTTGDVFLMHGTSTSSMAPPSLILISFDRFGQRRFEVDLTSEEDGVQYGSRLMLDEQRNRFFIVTRTYWPTQPGQHRAVLMARDSRTGALLWSRDLRALGVPVTNPTSSGGLALEVQALMSVGAGDVVAVLSEGSSIHQLHFVAFDGSSGAELWRTHRAGHASHAVSGSGELWTSWAPCWSFDNQLARFDGSGRTADERRLAAAPLAMSHDSALVFLDGGFAILEKDLVTARTLPLPAGRRPDSYSGATWADGDVTVVTAPASFGGPASVLTRISLDGGVRWTTPLDVENVGKSMTLVSDGGVAVGYWLADGGRTLDLFSNDGVRSDRCELGGQALSHIAAERLYSVSQNVLVAHDLPGVFAASSGWTGQGGFGGTGRPR